MSQSIRINAEIIVRLNNPTLYERITIINFKMQLKYTDKSHIYCIPSDSTIKYALTPGQLAARGAAAAARSATHIFERWDEAGSRYIG